MDLEPLVKVGGPVFALACFVVWIMDRHVRSMIKLLSNHLTHVEQKMDNVSTEIGTARFSIDQLVQRIDQLLIKR